MDLAAKNHQHPNADGFSIIPGFFLYFFFFLAAVFLAIFSWFFIPHTRFRYGVKKNAKLPTKRRIACAISYFYL